MKSALTFLLMLSFSLVLRSQVVINEFMAGNTETLQDESGEYDDWIEIYNPGAEAVNLGNYFLTDNFENPCKFRFPLSTTISAGGYLVVFADGDINQGNLHADFKLSLDGEEIAINLINGADTVLIDSLTFQTQSNDISYGRYPDGNSYFEFFPTPTPGASNISSNLEGIAPPAVFSIPGGFYSGTQSVELSSGITGAEIRYTTNGSEPTESSPLYSTPITSGATFVIKAKVFADDYAPGKTVANTYFVDEHFMAFNVSERLPVVSVSCNNEHLYGAQGILSNSFEDWERMVNFELFEPDGTSSVNQYAGIKAYGNATRRLPQISLALFARSTYGKGSFEYKFFDDKPFDKWESVVLRNGGSDWSLTYFRDALCQALVRNSMYIDAQGSKHAILYLNGEFYGIIDLKEKVNEHYVEMNRGADKDNIDMLSDDQTLINGDNRSYIDLRNYLINNNMAMTPLYNELQKKMDIPNFMNLQIAQIYIANLDMFLNSKFWRERENYGKWRWIMYDTEISFNQGDYNYTNTYGTSPWTNTLDFASSNSGGSGWPFLRPWSSEKLISVLNNESFRNEFIQTFAVHINTTFKPDRVLEMIDSMQLRVQHEIPAQIDAWGGVDIVFNPYGTHFTTMEEWEYYVDSMRVFAVQRPDYMRSFIMDKFSLAGMYDLTTTIDDPAQGNLYIQGIRVPTGSTGIYFDNVPLNVSVSPNEGYRFVRWEGVDGIDSISENITLTLSENTTIEAVFEPEADVMFTEILYRSTGNDSCDFIELYNPKHATTVNIGKYSLGGNIVFTFPDSTVIGPREYIVIAYDSSLIKSGNYTQVYEWLVGDLHDSVGKIVLKDTLGLIIDSVQYVNSYPWPVIADDRAIELISADLDNNNGSNWKEGISLGGSPGIPAFTDAVLALKINEFLANSNEFFADEMNEYNDWIEILNTGNEAVDIGGLYFTDTLDIPCRYQIPVTSPVETTIKPGEHKILWADNDIEQGPLHLGFKLDGSGGSIGISADGRTFIESLSYGDQSGDISYGRYTDGTDTWRYFSTPTPGVINSMPPEFTSTPVLTCKADELYEYNITWNDEDEDDIILGKLTLPYWLQITDINVGSALLSGVAPAGSAKTFSVNYFITDGYSSPVSQAFTIVKESPSYILNESFADNNFTCYPNPSEGVFTIELKTDRPFVMAEIMNIDGRKVFSKQLISSDGMIKELVDMRGYQKGLYFITITSGNGSFTQKILLF